MRIYSSYFYLHLRKRKSARIGNIISGYTDMSWFIYHYLLQLTIPSKSQMQEYIRLVVTCRRNEGRCLSKVSNRAYWRKSTITVLFPTFYRSTFLFSSPGILYCWRSAMIRASEHVFPRAAAGTLRKCTFTSHVRCEALRCGVFLSINTWNTRSIVVFLFT